MYKIIEQESNEYKDSALATQEKDNTQYSDSTSKPSDSNRTKKDSPVDIIVTAIAPTSIHLAVNTSYSSAVWCKTSAVGDILSDDSIMKDIQGEYVESILYISSLSIETKEIIISQLYPNTVYDVHCLVSFIDGGSSKKETVVIHSVITGDGVNKNVLII